MKIQRFVPILILCLIPSQCAIGQIGFFDTQCPEGWQKYSQAFGRTIVGAGFYSGPSEAKMFYLYQTGGEINHVLTISQMPRHDHSNGPFRHLLQSRCLHTTDGTDITCGQPDVVSSAEMLSVGYSQPHNNMPPYIVLNACKQIKVVSQTNQILISTPVPLILSICALVASLIAIIIIICFICERPKNQEKLPESEQRSNQNNKKKVPENQTQMKIQSVNNDQERAEKYRNRKA